MTPLHEALAVAAAQTVEAIGHETLSLSRDQFVRIDHIINREFRERVYKRVLSLLPTTGPSPEFITELRKLHETATPEPWAVWDGPQYCGGGHDLCIGAGEEWLANMEHFYGKDYDERVSHDSAITMSPGTAGAKRHHDVREIGGCPICSFNDEVDAKQKASADLIVALRNNTKAILDMADENARLRAENARLHEVIAAPLSFAGAGVVIADKGTK